MFRYLGFVVLLVATAAVDHWYGAIGVTRLFGGFWVATAVFMTFTPEIPFHVGHHYVGTFAGWTKMFVVLPCVGVGLMLIFYAPEVTCFSTKYEHLCA